MAIVQRTLDPTNPPKLTEETKARLDAMTDAERTANSLADPDTRALTDRFRLSSLISPDVNDLNTIGSRAPIATSSIGGTVGISTSEAISFST